LDDLPEPNGIWRIILKVEVMIIKVVAIAATPASPWGLPNNSGDLSSDGWIIN
jgi:hypothetical protein